MIKQNDDIFQTTTIEKRFDGYIETITTLKLLREHEWEVLKGLTLCTLSLWSNDLFIRPVEIAMEIAIEGVLRTTSTCNYPSWIELMVGRVTYFGESKAFSHLTQKAIVSFDSDTICITFWFLYWLDLCLIEDFGPKISLGLIDIECGSLFSSEQLSPKSSLCCSEWWLCVM